MGVSSRCVTALVLLLTGLALAGAAPPAEPLGLQAEFRAVPGKADDSYKLVCSIELDGGLPPVKIDLRSQRGGSGAGPATACHGALSRDKNWAAKVDGAKWTVSGWTDPKTKTFYPVKRITFSSEDLPAELLPKVTDTRPKG